MKDQQLEEEARRRIRTRTRNRKRRIISITRRRTMKQ